MGTMLPIISRKTRAKLTPAQYQFLLQMRREGLHRIRPFRVPPVGRWPASDQSLRANVNQLFMFTDWSVNTKLITDLQATDGATDLEAMGPYRVRLQAIRDTNPELFDWTGRYISGRRVEGTGVGVPHDEWPHAAIDYAEITPAYLGWNGNADWVNISIPAARTEFVRAIVEQVRLSHRPILFLDNIVHPNALPGSFTWADVCAFLAELKRAINLLGVYLMPNISGASFQWTAPERTSVLAACDAFSSETFWHPQCFDPTIFASAATRIANAEAQVSLYRAFLDEGKAVVGIPVAQGGFTQAQNGEFQCACAMLAWQPGDALFVCVGTQTTWLFPQTLGAPTADPQITGTDGNFLTYSRTFQNGTLTINTQTRTWSIA